MESGVDKTIISSIILKEASIRSLAAHTRIGYPGNAQEYASMSKIL